MTKELKYVINYNVFTNKHYAELLGGEFSNCYGQGKTPNEAVISLKIRVQQLRNQSKP